MVPDADAERDFYTNLGLTVTADNVLEGPTIEKMIGLPPGSGLNMKSLGDPEGFGLIELIEYRGVAGENRYPSAKPKALGALHVDFATPDLETLRTRLTAQSIPVIEHGPITTVFGGGPSISFASPAGLMIYVHQRTSGG